MPGGRAYHDRVSVTEQLDLGGVRYEAIKQPVRFRTQGNILDLSSGAPLSPDGAPVNVGDRIGVMQQAVPSQNGLYRVVVPGTGSNGQWVRDGDLPAGALTTSKLLVGVQEGTDAGTYDGVAPTNKVLRYEGLVIFRMEGERIAEVWVISNWARRFAALQE